MEFKKQDHRRGVDEHSHGNREIYVPRQGKRQYDRHDGTGRGFRNSKKDGAGQHNWGNDVEEELHNAINLEEIAQVPPSEQAIIEKADHIGKGIEDEPEKNEKPAETIAEEKQLTLEEFRKQQLQARKNFQNKELFRARRERVADVVEGNAVHPLTTSEDDNLIQPSITAKPKKKKIQRSHKAVVVENTVIGFSPTTFPTKPAQNRKNIRLDKSKTEKGKEVLRLGGEHRENRGRGSAAPRAERINVEDMRNFPVLKA